MTTAVSAPLSSTLGDPIGQDSSQLSLLCQVSEILNTPGCFDPADPDQHVAINGVLYSLCTRHFSYLIQASFATAMLAGERIWSGGHQIWPTPTRADKWKQRWRYRKEH